MAYEVNHISVDLLNDTAVISIHKNENGKGFNIHINIPIETPGNQPENRLKQISKAAAKQALLEAANAL